MHRLLILPVLITSTLLLTSQQAAGQNENPYRTWRDRTGTYQVEARLVRINEKEVELERKEDSKTIKLPLDALSSRDRQYLVRQQRNSAARPGAISVSCYSAARACRPSRDARV